MVGHHRLDTELYNGHGSPVVCALVLQCGCKGVSSMPAYLEKIRKQKILPRSHGRLAPMLIPCPSRTDSHTISLLLQTTVRCLIWCNSARTNTFLTPLPFTASTYVIFLTYYHSARVEHSTWILRAHIHCGTENDVSRQNNSSNVPGDHRLLLYEVPYPPHAPFLTGSHDLVHTWQLESVSSRWSKQYILHTIFSISRYVACLITTTHI